MCFHRVFIHADVDYALAPMTTPTRRGGDQPAHVFICQLCGSEGIPRTVTIGAGIKIVKLECPACRHQWNENLPDARIETAAVLVFDHAISSVGPKSSRFLAPARSSNDHR